MRLRIVLLALFAGLLGLVHGQDGFRTSLRLSGLPGPICLAFAPDGRLFVGMKNGEIHAFDGNGSLGVFATIACSTDDNRGLLSIAFDPNFASNRFIYAFYTTNSQSLHPPATPKNRVSRFTELNNRAVPGSEVVILDGIPSDSGFKNGGCIRFGIDGKLYISTGDGGNPAQAQSLTSLAGKLLRINPDGTIPPDNPFVGGGNRGEIWARGFRQPFRFAFRPGTVVPYICDVGNELWEEINVGVKGGNFGWNLYEGPVGAGGIIDPIHAYAHNGGLASIIGGCFVGDRFPVSYQNRFIYADYMLNFLYSLEVTPQNTKVEWRNFTYAPYPVDMAYGPDGALYVVSIGFGEVHRIAYEPEVSSVTGPVGIVGGNAAQGTVTLEFPASAAGQLVTLTSSTPSLLQVPASVNVPAGEMGVGIPMTTTGVNANTSVTLSARTYSVTKSTTIGVLRAGISSVLASPNPVVGGNNATGTVILNGKAGSNGANVSLFSGNSVVAQVPSSMSISAFGTTGTFPITTIPVGAVTHLSITATLGDSSKAVSLTVHPVPMLVNSLVINPKRIPSGTGTTGTVTISAPAPQGGQPVDLAVNASAVVVPQVVTVPAASTVVSFPITTKAIDYTVTVNVIASIRTSKRISTLTLDPCPIRAFAVFPTSIPGGVSVNGQVVLRSAAPAGGATVGLSDNSPATSPQSSVFIPAGQTTGNFFVLTAVVSNNVISTLTATYAGAVRTTQLTVTNVVALHSVTVNPTQVKGGSSATGRVVLTKVATSAEVVSLSDNMSILTTPPSVTVSIGANQANFPVTTLPVSASYTGTIIAQHNGLKRTCTLRVDP